MIDIESLKRNEEDLYNKNEYLDHLNNNKLSLRKSKNNRQIKNKRDYKLLYENESIFINKEYQFHIINFDSSFNIIENYLKSNNSDLISYCLREICLYFSTTCPKIKEQQKIIETKFLNILLFFGKKFIQENNFEDLSNVLRILINIQSFEEGNKEYLKDIYSNDFFNFYNNCLIFINKSNKNKHKTIIYRIIIHLLIMMAFYDNEDNYNLNFLFFRSQVFLQILDFFEAQNFKEIEDIKSTLELIVYTLEFTNLEEEMFDDNDIHIIDKILNILIQELYSGNKEELLVLIYEGISHISLLNGKSDRNVKIIDGGVTLKILKMKFNKFKLTNNYLKIILFSMRILANNLTASDKNCQIFYDQNIIDYYNLVFDKFDDEKSIVKAVLYGINNIAISSKYDVLKSSIIWNEDKIQKYLSYDDEIKIQIIKTVKYLLYKNNKEWLKFIFECKILEYLIHIFVSFNIGKLTCNKILELIDYYLSMFKKEFKEKKEYLIIYNKFKDLFQSSEKIILFNEEKSKIHLIEKRIRANYE